MTPKVTKLIIREATSVMRKPLAEQGSCHLRISTATTSIEKPAMISTSKMGPPLSTHPQPSSPTTIRTPTGAVAEKPTSHPSTLAKKNKQQKHSLSHSIFQILDVHLIHLLSETQIILRTLDTKDSEKCASMHTRKSWQRI